MPAPRKLKPATKKLLAAYGARRPCLHYCCNPVSQTIVKTAEIIVEESAHQPRPRRLWDDQLVAVQIGWKEFDPQRQGKQAGGKWNPARRLWEMRRDQVLKLGLKDRIVTSEGTISSNPEVTTKKARQNKLVNF